MERSHRSYDDLATMVAGWSEDELTQALDHWETVKSHAVANQAAILAEADRRQMPLADGCRTITDWAAWRLDVSHDTARRYVTLARRLSDLPDTAGRLTGGAIGPERAAAVTSIATAATETDLLDRLSGHDLSGVCRFVARHRRISRHSERHNHDRSYLTMQPTLDEGWWDIHGGVTGVAGATINAALTKRADDFPATEGSVAHRQALALETICADSLDPGANTTGPTRTGGITAFVDLGLAGVTGGEAGAELAYGPRLGPDALTEILCGGTVRLVGLHQGRPVVTTPDTRTIPPAIRDYVRWRDGACRAPGCRSRYRLQPHHIHPYSHGGGHHPDNLIAVCWFHHHVVIHRRGHSIDRQADGSIHLVPPSPGRDPP